MTATTAIEVALETPVSARAGASERFYRPELDALRAGAFLLVFVHHSLPQQAPGWRALGLSPATADIAAWAIGAGGYGVDLFFALSSYLITELLLRERAALGRLDVRAFYVRRILRIWPLYYAFLAAAILVIPHVLYGNVLGSCYRLPYTFLAGNWANALCGVPNSAAAPLWSVSIEEQFYLVWPLLISRLSDRGLTRACVALLFTATVARVVYAFYGAGDDLVWASTITRLDPIALGALLALGLRGRRPEWSPALRLGIVIAALGAMVLARAIGLSGPGSVLSYPLVAIASVALLAATIGIRMSFPGAAALVWLGRISYGLYVFHFFAIAFARALPPLRRLPSDTEPGALAVVSAIALVLTLLMATVSYYVLERPALRFKARYARVRSRDA